MIPTDVSFGGDAVARHPGGMAVFIPFALPDETVTVRITQVAKRYARAELVQILTPSSFRCEAPCPLYGRCGGCCYQHVDDASEARFKQGQLEAALSRIGGLALPEPPRLTPASKPFGYRNKIVLHGPGYPHYLAMDHRTPVPVTHCPLAEAPINDVLKTLSSSPLTEDIWLRCDADGQVIRFPVGRVPEDLTLREQIGHLSFAVPADAFFQVNRSGAAELTRRIQEWIRKIDPEMLIDAYCGVGLFSLCGALHKEMPIHGMEAHAGAIHAARRNAREAGFTRADFQAGTTETLLPPLLARTRNHKALVLLDPPRSGCAPSVLSDLGKHRPQDLIYISCNPPALARDLKSLCASGYELRRVEGVNLFPQTAHFEAVVHLSLR